MTVFVTAFEQHAVQAFDLQVVDYLTKPVKSGRLKRALERVRYRIAAQEAFLSQTQFSSMVDTLRTKDNPQPAYANVCLSGTEQRTCWLMWIQSLG